MSWWDVNGGYANGDQIVVYLYQSEQLFCQTSSSAVVERVSIGVNQTWARLNISIPNFEAGDLIDDSCQYFWVAYVRQNGQVAACSCLRARPNWMWDLKDQLQNAPLRKTLLPGTHDACAYARFQGGISNNIATKYAVAQSEDLFNQLALGVRYLDVRILQRPGNEEARFWTNHGAYIFRPLFEDTALVREFLSRTNEIVIFDIHGLDGMGDEPDSHQELQTLLYNEFSPWMAPQNLTWDVTLGQLWALNKRLIVTYNDEANQVGVPYLWSAVQHQWGNVNKVGELQIYLQGVMDTASQGSLEFPWSAMAELTPSTSDVITDSLGGLRNAADAVNRNIYLFLYLKKKKVYKNNVFFVSENVTVWFRDLWSKEATIVATDFFLGNNIVDVAIKENQRRFP